MTHEVVTIFHNDLSFTFLEFFFTHILLFSDEHGQRQNCFDCILAGDCLFLLQTAVSAVTVVLPSTFIRLSNTSR